MTVTFGNYIRAARLGFHWVEPLGRFVRLCADGDGWVIFACLPSALPSRCAPPEQHVCWWEGWSGEQLMDHCPALHVPIGERVGMAVLHVDDDGNLVEQNCDRRMEERC